MSGVHLRERDMTYIYIYTSISTYVIEQYTLFVIILKIGYFSFHLYCVPGIVADGKQ